MTNSATLYHNFLQCFAEKNVSCEIISNLNVSVYICFAELQCCGNLLSTVLIKGLFSQ